LYFYNKESKQLIMSETTRTRGVLLVNLGTPEAPTRKAVARYLREFLSDPRVVDLPRWIWLPILNLIIVPLRAGRSAEAYASIWTEHGSPLLVHSQDLARQLAVAVPDGVPVELAMRYGKPSINGALERLRSAGVEDLTVLPMYPQFSHTTTTSVYDAVEAALDEKDWSPVLHRIEQYFEHPDWLRAVANSIQSWRATHGEAERLLFSLHGIPQRFVQEGDPYADQCSASVAGITDLLGLNRSQWCLAFQSRVGREPWLQPYTDITLKQWAEAGIQHVQAVCPGFAVDCIETLEEVEIRYNKEFIAAGGEKLELIPCLNGSDAHARALAAVLRDAWD
jgi:ferrochelatase